ncbi:MAG TPA: hypothetical protein VJT09_02250, partial [Pyrinomonadaceae bacterium]|nr:hypothetical protein [Pyrinomonadaceae bacterium]
RFSTGLLIMALGGISLALALKNNFKPLIVTGVVALAILAFDFFTYKMALRQAIPSGGIEAGGASGQFGRLADELTGVVIQPAWGMFAIAAGAILLIVAGAMTDKSAVKHTDWNENPPPPMNYS